MIFPVMMPTTQANNIHQTSSSSSRHQSTSSSSSSSNSMSNSLSSRHHHQIQPPKHLQQPNTNRAHHHQPTHLHKPSFQTPIAPPAVDHHFNQRIMADLYRTMQMDPPQMMDPNIGYIKDTTGQLDVDHLKHGLHNFPPPRAHIWWLTKILFKKRFEESRFWIAWFLRGLPGFKTFDSRVQIFSYSDLFQSFESHF